MSDEALSAGDPWLVILHKHATTTHLVAKTLSVCKGIVLGVKIEDKAEAMQRMPVDVIVPVYGGYEETIASVITASETIDRRWARLVIINDCSPEPEITHWLRDNKNYYNYELLENNQNLGFVGTANRGMRLNESADVLLLNSDVEVANNWLERLQDTAYKNEKIASVTATANNATICSFPIFCEDNELLFDMEVESIDEAFKKYVPEKSAVTIPTGVGCCMYMRRDALEAIGYFDEEVFGRGYGEENDWCQRAIGAGYDNLHSLNVFIYHKGSVSFADESSPRKEANLALLNKRYPNYIPDVHKFIARDPAAVYRIKALMGMISDQEKPVVLALSHGMGGGVKTNILELAETCKQSVHLLLEPYKEGVVRLSFLPLVKNGPHLDFIIPDEYEVLLGVLRFCGVNHVHFHHTMGLPTELWAIAEQLGVEADYTLHDFWVVNGNPTLTDEEGVYVGDCDDRDERCARRYPLPSGISSKQWRLNQLYLMERARYLICPSQDTLRRISSEQEFKHLNNWLAVPHPDHSDLTDEINWGSRAEREVFKVVVLGALSPEKGADILEAVASALMPENIEFHLLGYAYRPLGKAVITHGAYPENECVDRLIDLNPDVVWFTAQWPETYSYTLSAAIKAKLPVVVPNLGAFPERVSGRYGAYIINEYANVASWVEFWRKVLLDRSLLKEQATKLTGYTEVMSGFYFRDYLPGLSHRSQGENESTNIAVLASLLKETNKHEEEQEQKNQMLSILIKLREHPATSWLSKAVPFSLQRKLKSYLSRKPFHSL